MNVECCGEPRASRFCPECGANLGKDDPIAWLIVHCRQNEKSNRTRADRHRFGVDFPSGSWKQDLEGWRRYCEEHAEDSESKADAWKARGDALSALVRGEGER